MEKYILLFAISQVLEGVLLGTALYFFYRKRKKKAKEENIDKK